VLRKHRKKNRAVDKNLGCRRNLHTSSARPWRKTALSIRFGHSHRFATVETRYRVRTAASNNQRNVLVCTAGFLNPMGMHLVWLSALPATARAKSGLLWLRYYIPEGTVPERRTEGIERSHGWITVAVFLSAAFVLVLGRGITLHR
jgi:hypothetical protein